ncbi:MAG: TonB-dependent receptor [Methylovulum sp.]|nr:TonB-dependent receptor [Methylovulum sp.]
MSNETIGQQPDNPTATALPTADGQPASNAANLCSHAARTVKLGSVAAIIAGVSLLAPDYVLAEEKPVNYELEYENNRLKQELLEANKERERLKKALAESGNAAASQPVATETVTTPPPAAAEPAFATAEVKNKDFVEEPKNLSEVVVTSRRKEEKLQDVPIPIAVVTGETLRRDNIVRMEDVARRVPNLGVTSTNVRQTSIALRGLGKNSGNESMESSVGVMVDNVWSSWVGSTWTNYVDLDHVEVLRGPQGTLQGKNSNLGLINVNTKLPSFKSGFYVDGFAGNRDALQGKASATGTVLPGLLAYRAAIFVDKRDGFVRNLDTPVTQGDAQETNALGGRIQFLLTPSDTVSARIIADRSSTTQTMSINPLQDDPATFADGTLRTTSFTTRLNRDWFDNLRNSGQPLTVTGDPRKIAQNDRQVSRGDQEGVSGEISWDLGSHKLTSISAYRDSLFEPHHDGDSTTADIQHISGWTVQNKQWTQELRLASQTPGPVDYQVGLFGMRTSAETNNQRYFGSDAGAFYASNKNYALLSADPFGRQLMSDSLNNVLQTGYLNPQVTSLAAYGQANWHITDKATLTLGLRETWEHRDNRGNAGYIGGVDLTQYAGATAEQIAAAQATRSAAIGNIWTADRQGFEQDAQNWLVNPSYKINKDLMVYFSVAGGQKSGAAQFSNDGSIENVNPEDVMDYELGVKSSWFNRKLAVNANLYRTNVEGFQSQLTVPDSSQASGYRTTLGNIDGIQLQGIELETVWQARAGLSLFLNGSYNDAVYTDFKNAPCPSELNSSAACDQTGYRIPNAPEFTANFGADYRLPFGLGMWNDMGLQWHAFLVNSYKSRANYNASLSSSGVQDAYHVTDGGIGISTKNGQYNLDLVGRNIFDTIYLTNAGSFSSSAAPSGTYGDARYFGVHFRSTF